MYHLTLTLVSDKIGILACDEIADYSDLKLNNDTQNITVSETQVPVLGVVTVA